MIDLLQPIRFYSVSTETLAYKQAKNGYNYVPRLLIDRTSLLSFGLARIRGNIEQRDAVDEIPITTLKLVNVNNPSNYIDLLSGTSALDLSFNITYYTDEVVPDSYVASEHVDIALYKGDTTIPQIPIGKWQIQAEDDDSNEWYSCYLISAIPSKTVKFQFRNTISKNYFLCDDDFYWTMIFDSYVHDTGEWDITEEQFTNEYGEIYTGFRRDDKIYECSIFIDKCGFDALYYMSNYCDTVLVTDEVGQTNTVTLKPIEAQSFGHSNHIETKIRFTIPDNQLLSIPTNEYWEYATQEGGGSIIARSSLLMSKDKKVKSHGKFIKRR